eukprot:scaffold84467_cov69-Phaeocystis_antarctica.AAC.2
MTRGDFQSDGRSAMLNTGCKSSRPRMASARASSFSPARAYRMASRLTMVRITELSSWSMRYLPSVRCSPGPSMTLSWLGLGLGLELVGLRSGLGLGSWLGRGLGLGLGSGSVVRGRVGARVRVANLDDDDAARSEARLALPHEEHEVVVSQAADAPLYPDQVVPAGLGYELLHRLAVEALDPRRRPRQCALCPLDELGVALEQVDRISQLQQRSVGHTADACASGESGEWRVVRAGRQVVSGEWQVHTCANVEGADHATAAVALALRQRAAPLHELQRVGRVRDVDVRKAAEHAVVRRGLA